MKKIMVAEVVSRLEFGGVESVILNYISNFNRIDDYEFHIITQDINDSNCIQLFKDSGFFVHIVPHKRKSIIQNCIEIAKIFREFQFDVVHSHMNLTNFYVLFIAKAYGIKIRICHCHSAYVENGILNHIFWEVLKFLNKKSSNIWMACGQKAGEFLFGKKEIAKNRVYMVNNAINTDKFEFDSSHREMIRDKYMIENRGICVGHVGRFMDVKNHNFLIDIFYSFHKIHNNSKLLLIGDGELFDSIKEKVSLLGLDKDVIFTGNINDVNRYYSAMDIFVLPSKFEGLPVVIIEAQDSGLPCIISQEVDCSAKINNNVFFMSIDQLAEEWALKIDSMTDGQSRISDASKILATKGYDILVESEKLDKIYRGLED